MVKKAFALIIVFFNLCIHHIDAYTEKKLVIIITSYNNAEWFEKNVGMMFAQKKADGSGFYENYRIIYVDDCSLDGTPELVEHYIDACNQKHRVMLLKNRTRKRALANFYVALQHCKPDEIVFNMDGDDWLADEYVFAKINDIYQDPNIWITYGSYINWPTQEMGYCQPFPNEYVEKQLFRKKWWKPGQLRTFYAWLAQQVQLKDLFFEGPYFQGQFFPANADLALYYPMMEMAGFHYKFIPEIIYIRNVATPLNDFKANKEVQILGSKLLREKPCYARLDAPQATYFNTFANRKADIVFFSQNPSLAERFIRSCQQLVKNSDTIHLLYQATNAADEERFKKIQSTAPLNIIQITNFKETLMQTLSSSTQDHILFAHDGIIVNHFFDCASCILTLEKTFAYAFYLNLGFSQTVSHQTGTHQPVPALNKIYGPIYAWAFHYAESGDWRCYNNLEATLYRTTTAIEQIGDLLFNSRRELFEEWSKVPINLESVGLCFQEPHVRYIQWH